MVTERIFSRRVQPVFRLCWQFSFQFTGIKTSARPQPFSQVNGRQAQRFPW